MMKQAISHVRPALFGAAIALFIVLVALIGLARLTVDEPAPPAPQAAPAAELVAGTAVFDTAAVAAERGQDVIGALLMFFALFGAVCALACGVWAGVLVRRAAQAESGVDKGEEAFSRDGLARRS